MLEDECLSPTRQSKHNAGWLRFVRRGGGTSRITQQLFARAAEVDPGRLAKNNKQGQPERVEKETL